MGIDIGNIPAEARADYIAAGERFSSEDTLAQADATLEALEQHGPALVAHGFGTADAVELKDARQGLLAAGVERSNTTAAKSGKRADFRKVLRAGKDTRGSARSVLAGARGALVKVAGAAAKAAAGTIDVALAQTATAGDSPTKLGEQLTLLRNTLSEPTVKAAAEGRGGASAVAALEGAISALATSTRPAKLGTPEQTELLNIYDGIILEKARLARKAARAAARQSGTPALADAFALNALSGSHAPASPAPAPTPATG